jgi:uncharacterized LabA/DUF88 family protein
LTSPLAAALRNARRIEMPAGPALAAETLSPIATPEPRRVPPPIAEPVPLASGRVAPFPADDRRASAPPVDMSRLVRPSDRVALFIDGANTDGAARTAGYFIDFRKAREFFVAGASFYAAFYYVADFTTSGDPLQQRFFDFLSHAGYIVRRRPVKVMRDQDTGERIIKGNLDTEIVLDMMNTVDNYDVAFLFSGDSDFERAVELLRSRGRRVFVVSARGPLSRELAYVADKPIVYLEDVRQALARPEPGPASSSSP